MTDITEKEKRYSKSEEIANAGTHGLGIIFGIVSGIYLFQLANQSNDKWAVCSVLVYTVCMLSSYLTSTLYHSCTSSQKKALLRKFDHAAIYLHIAGTYTPFTLVVLRDVGFWGWAITLIVWIAAIAGVILSFRHKKAGSKLETICYVVIGCVIVVAIKPLIDTLSPTGSINALYWLLAGGVSYIVGAVLYSFKKIKYMHSVFHLFVLGGSVCHILAIAGIFK